MNPQSSNLKYTTEQQAALTAHDRSVSLAAGAGCGKTFVLTERFLSHLDPRILEPTAELSELVAITFTDAAAREMRDRIRRRCFERLAESTDASEQQAWRRLLRTLDAAQISTIHSFCGRLLRSHAVEARLDPSFEQLDQSSADMLRLRTLDDRLRQLLLARDERLIQLATRFKLSGLREHLARLVGQEATEAAQRWRSATPADLIATWKNFLRTTIAPRATDEFLAQDAVRQLVEICRSPQTAVPALRSLCDQLLELFTSLPASTDPQKQLVEIRQLARVQGNAAKQANWADKSAFETFRDTCKEVRDWIDKSILFRPWNGEHLEEAARTGLDLLELAADVTDCFELAKQRQNVLEFDDLMIRAHQLLTDPANAALQRRLIQNTKLLLVDEFQDTDPLQVKIVQAFCGPHWADKGLFVVGDFKQSIYRFRGAEPRVSQDLQQTLPDSSRLSLTTNFRSQGAVLDFVNALFCDAFEEKYEPLRPLRPQQTPTPAVELLWAPTDSPEDTTIPIHYRGSGRARYLEARFIAQRLAELIDSREPLVVGAKHEDSLSGKLRAMRPGDIAILLRSLSDVAIYESALREQGLEYYLTGGHAFYAQQEIFDVLHLLRAVVSVADELSLAGALRSPLFSLADETLYWLVNESGSLHAGLFAESLPPELTEGERSKVAHAARVIHELRQTKDRLLIAELLTLAVELTGYDAVLLTEFLGERKLANLLKLIEQARTLDRTSPGDLSGFVLQLSQFVTRAKEAVAVTAAGDVVRIMTIHQAKGLEFPVVVIPDLERRPPPEAKLPVFHPELGPLVASQDKTCVGWNLIQFVERQEEQAEKVRLLYVACTRAADYLILSSSLSDPSRPRSDWLKFIGERFDLTTGKCLATLPAGFQTPIVRVITSEPESQRPAASRSRGADLVSLVDKSRQLAQTNPGVIPELVAPISTRQDTRRRYSFSRMSGKLVRRTDQAKLQTPEGVAEELDPRGLGTLVHAVVERIRFKPNPPSITEVRDLCDFLAPQHLDWQAGQAAEQAAKMIGQFLQGDRARQLGSATCLLREVEFLFSRESDSSISPRRYLHGFMDCLYQDPQGDWHLLDYKSNHIVAAGVPELARGYELQMFVYSRACEKTLGGWPVESVLCFLQPGIEVSFRWNDDQRRQLEADIDRGLTGDIILQR